MDAVPDTKPAYSWNEASKVKAAMSLVQKQVKAATDSIVVAAGRLQREAESDSAIDIDIYTLSRAVDEVTGAMHAIQVYQGLMVANKHLPEATY